MNFTSSSKTKMNFWSDINFFKQMVQIIIKWSVTISCRVKIFMIALWWFLKCIFYILFSPAVDRFPILECDREIASNSIERARSATSSTASSTDSQDREVIFALPSLHLHFRTEHKQGPSTPQPSGKYSLEHQYIKW